LTDPPTYHPQTLNTQATPARYLPSILVTSNECAQANKAGLTEQAAEEAELKRLVTLLGPTRLVRPK
jgi:hypothetical protein